MASRLEWAAAHLGLKSQSDAAVLDAILKRHRKDALEDAQDALRGEDNLDWARRAHGSTISLPFAMKAIDDLIEETEA